MAEKAKWTLGRQLMEFIGKHKHNLTDVGFDEDTAWWEWKEGSEAKINEFLKDQEDIREHAEELNQAPKGAKCRRCGTKEIPLIQRIDVHDMGAQYFLCMPCYRANPREDWTPAKDARANKHAVKCNSCGKRCCPEQMRNVKRGDFEVPYCPRCYRLHVQGLPEQEARHV